nr:hypothetical protein [Janibacter alkaliphilus]
MSTGVETKAARKPSRSSPATIPTAPVSRASSTVTRSTSAGSVPPPGMPPRCAPTMLAESAAVADIGATTRWRELPSRA